ncbi:hypothetical protein F5Y17DRAFT_105794 [Xylariaceae sp. FL0594]|nr:hypothetical protein F5Y17DRAFT_105794 [Xylariaceae sp. FL0594]
MVSEVLASPAGLDALLPRPPTPPREHRNDLEIKLLSDRCPLPSRIALLETPPSHSPSSIRSTNDSTRRSRKRVEFTVLAEYRDPPNAPDRETDAKKATPSAALSSASSVKTLKSILKPTSSPCPPNPLDSSAQHGEPATVAGLATMLESTIKQLAGNDRDSRVDAYTMLVRALKASSNLPDRIALQSKMGLFTQFIQRDVAGKGANGAVDFSLVNHSLTLLCTFLHFPAIAASLGSEFGVFIIDHCIRSFEDPAMPKDVVRHLMKVVVSQEFSAKVMSSDRVGRLVASLRNIENHMTGKSIVMSRILIYRKLLRQSPAHMVSHSDWLWDLFTDMQSSIKEICAAAIALGLEAGFSAAKEKQVSKKVQEILQLSNDGVRYVEWYARRLSAMTEDKEDKSSSAAVPQIWSVVILLLRCQVERWDFFDPWLKIIQRCFNSTDYQTKLEANYAWNRLVYTQHLYPSSFSKTVKILCQPFNQLKRRGKQTDEFRKVVIGGICNLYYYAFKPNTPPTQIDQYWDACVEPLMQTLTSLEDDANPTASKRAPGAENVSQAALILSGLFDSSSLRIWKEDRVKESAVARPSDVPALDPKWIRRNAGRVFSLVDRLLHRSFLDLAVSDSNISKLWVSLTGAVATAGSKEIKVSAETANFIGHSLSLLAKVWATGLGEGMRSAEEQQSFLKAVETYVTTMIVSLGHLPFTEKLLSMNSQNTYTAAAASTPSHRSVKGHGPARSPVQHLFSILSLLPPGISEGQPLFDLFDAIFQPFVLTRTRRSRRELVQELIHTPALGAPASCGPWIFIAGMLRSPFDQSQSSFSSSDSTNQLPIGHDFRDLVKHLEKVFSHTPGLPWTQWLSLYEFAIEQATEVSGEAGCSVAVVEPLAKAIGEGLSDEKEPFNPNLVQCGLKLLQAARQPRDRQALDAARRRLWGTTAAGVRSASFDPFDHLYRLTCRLLEMSYTSIDAIDEGLIASLITETSSFLSRANPVLVFKSLVLLQPGLVRWIQDADERYGSKQRAAVAEAVKSLWDRICDLFSEATLKNFQLDAIEQLLCCALTSKHRYVVNSAVLLWNQAFENEDNVVYPDALKDVLLSLRPYVDIVLPGLDGSLSGTRDLAPLFIESQDDLDFTNPNFAASDPVLPPAHLETPKRSQAALSSKGKSTNSQPRSRPRSARLAKRTKTPKLRHDDSQVQFAPIEEPSPSRHEHESQALTDRQREVRERQLENAALFPSIRSSPKKPDQEKMIPSSIPASCQSNLVQSLVKSPPTDRSATPKATRSFDYVSSTPTPRRGQTSMVYEDHEMADDVPSSPPEPRRNLLPEMRPHSRNSDPLDDMPISSSPLSGSPVPKALFRYETDRSIPRDALFRTAVEPMTSQQQSFIDETDVAALPCSVALPKGEPATTGSLAVCAEEEPTADLPSTDKVLSDSDNEVYVDALSSPASSPKQPADFLLPPTSLRIQESKNLSFAMSEAEERSLARLVIEIDSRKCEPLPSYDSPEKKQEVNDAKECITILPAPEPQRAQTRLQVTRSQSPVQPPVVETDSSQTSVVRRSGRKRKRTAAAADKSEGVSGAKRRRGGDVRDVEVAGAAMSQVESFVVEPEHASQGTLEALSHAQSSPDLSCVRDDVDTSVIQSFALDEDEEEVDPDTAAVNLQLITEASQSQQSVVVDRYTVERDEDEDKDEQMDDDYEEPPLSSDKHALPTPPSAAEGILSSLTESLQRLKNATLIREEGGDQGLLGDKESVLTRGDVFKIEDMLMDIRRELYELERRSRC